VVLLKCGFPLRRAALGQRAAGGLMLGPAGTGVEVVSDLPRLSGDEHAIEIDRYGGPAELVWRPPRRAPARSADIEIRRGACLGGRRGAGVIERHL
jgi:hypothetical protein